MSSSEFLASQEAQRTDTPVDFCNRFVSFTGEIEITRAEANRRVINAGGFNSISLTHPGVLIVGDNPGSKLQRAEAKGIYCMPADQFLRLTTPINGQVPA